MRCQLIVSRFLPVLFLLSFASAAFSEEVDNPQYQNWAKYNVGTSVTHEAVSTIGGKEVHITTTNTLVEKLEDKCIIESAITMGEGMPTNKMKQNVNAKIDKSKLNETGEEDVEAAGKTYKCKIVEMTIARQNPNANARVNEVKAKLWVNGDVPGGIVKMETTLHSGTMTSLLKSYEIK